MIRVLSRRSNDVSYFTDDRALEIEGLRDGEPGWWLRGAGDSGDPRCVAEVLRTSQRSSILGYDIVVAALVPLRYCSRSTPNTDRVWWPRIARRWAPRLTISKSTRSWFEIAAVARTAIRPVVGPGSWDSHTA